MKGNETSDLEAVKRLLLLMVVKLGASSEEIGAALGMHPGAVRKLISISKIKKADFVR